MSDPRINKYFRDLEANHLEVLLDNLPNGLWNYSLVSMNPNLTMKYILENPSKPWDMVCYSMNPTITWATVMENPEFPWNYDGLSRNPNITGAIVRENPDLPWDYGQLSENPNIRWVDVLLDPTRPWDYEGIARNDRFLADVKTGNLTRDVLHDRSPTCESADWFTIAQSAHCLGQCRGPSSNPHITYRDVLQDPNAAWNYTGISINRFNKDPQVRLNLVKLAAAEDQAIERRRYHIHEHCPLALASLIIDYIYWCV